MKSGDRVGWEYISGGGMYGAGNRIAKGGSGVLGLYPTVGSSLFITGDYGITTSAIVKVRKYKNTLLITTMNSKYRVIE